MAFYRNIDSSFWTDPKIRKLDPLNKLLALYLITNPHSHLSGIYYIDDGAIARETNIPQRRLDTLWDTLSDGGFARRDHTLQIVWVMNMLKHQGKGDKNARSAAKQLKSLHNSFLLKEFLEKYPQVAAYFPDRVSDRVSDTLSASATLEQEQEQEQEQDSARSPKKNSRPTVEEVRAYCLERKNTVNPEKWFDHYTSNGWRVGKNPMRDWKAAVRNWERTEINSVPVQPTPPVKNSPKVQEYIRLELERNQQP